MTEIQSYIMTLTINSVEFNTIVPVDNTICMVDIFTVFPTVNRTAFTNYSLSVAAINSVGQSSFTQPVSVGEA